MRLRIAAIVTAACVAGCALHSERAVSGSAGRLSYDLIVRGGSVIDGTGREAYRADVGVSGGHIVAVGDLSRETAAAVIDAAGLAVSPGFINIHSHASALANAANMLRQGVTTEILNPDGGGAVDVARQIESIAASPIAVNAGAYAPFNAVWSQVVGSADRRPTADEIARMTALLEHALDAGAWGVSAGLDYKPAYFARVDEVIAVLSPLARRRTNFPNHDRLTPEAGYSSLAGMRETIEIGERAGLLPVITHMKLQGHEQGRVGEAHAMMRAAGARGVYVAADAYPYLAGQTALAQLFVPGWAQEGGRNALLERLKDREQRARIEREATEAVIARVGGAHNVRVLSRGKTLAELMPMLDVQTAGEAIAKILETESPTMIATFGAEADLVSLLQHPDTAVACDCGAGPRATHPRSSGSFPRVLGRYVRESSALRLPDAVRKMTGLPAAIVGMVDRGFLAPGMAADITVFDAATVIDRATYDAPAELPEGIRFVVVNGSVALRDGAPTAELAGQVLRRSDNMPSRPMAVSAAGPFTLNARGAAGTIKVDLVKRQLLAVSGSVSWEGVAFGVVQTAPRWRSVTGVARRAGTGEHRAFTLIDDHVTGAVTLTVDGEPAVRIDAVTPTRN